MAPESMEPFEEAPMDLFTNVERSLVLSLPFDEYEVADWKTAIVHPDHYIQVNKKAYSMPEEYIGCEILVKVNERTISIYFKDELVKIHTLPNGYRQTDMNDFPDNQCHRLEVPECLPT